MDIGGTKCAVVLGTRKLKLLDRISFPTDVRKGLTQTLGRLFGESVALLDG